MCDYLCHQEEDNIIQMKKDLLQFLYQVRISAKVFIIEMPDSDISAYTYERTMVMEERQRMLQQIKLSRRERRGNIQDVVDYSHRKGASHSPPSRDKIAYRPTWSSIITPFSQSREMEATPQLDGMEQDVSAEPSCVTSKAESDSNGNGAAVPVEKESVSRFEIHETEEEKPPAAVSVSPSNPVNDWVELSSEKKVSFLSRESVSQLPEPSTNNLRRMNTSVRLNELIVERSHGAKLVVINLPSPPDRRHEEESYMAFLEVLTEGLDRVLMIRGGGNEVVSIF